MIKVLFLIHDLEVGGAEKVLVNLVNNMARDRFDVTVMTLFDVGVNKQFLKAHINYKSCFKRPIRGNSHLMKLLSPKRLYKMLVKDRYDIVISYLEGPTARIVGGAPNDVKVVSWVHSTINSIEELSRSFRTYSEAKRCYYRADRMSFVSSSVKDSFLSVCSTENNVVLYNVNETDIIIEKSKESLYESFSKSDFNICCVGRLTQIKGFDRIIDITKRLNDKCLNVRLHIFGVGELEDRLKQKCKTLGIESSVTFWGYQLNPYKFVSKCDLFVCSSYSEGFSTAATEALIVGTPVCTVEVSGMKEMLGDNNEFGIVTENNDEALYNAIKDLINNPEKLAYYRKRASERGKVFSKENTVKAVEDMLIKLYEE